jgi:peptide/nickel transport system substrate-binding protein
MSVDARNRLLNGATTTGVAWECEMTHRRGPSIGLLLIGLVVAACGGTASPAPASGPAASGPAASAPTATRGGTVTLSMFEEPDTLDPTFAGTAGAREVFINMCERLYDIDAEGNLVPQLASAMPKVSADGLNVTIDIRTGAKFNDGTPMDVASVVASLERHRTEEGSRRKSELANVTKIEAAGGAIVLTLSKPDASLTGTLSDRAGMIMSPAQIAKLGKDFGTSPVCVGPFKFVERVAGDHITLERATDYYDAEHVYLDKVIYKPIADETVRSANLRSGDLQLVDRVATTDVAALQADPKFTFLKVTSNAYASFTVNVANANGLAGEPGKIKSPLADPKLREAFDLALDREQINTIVYSGLQQVGCGPISPANPFYDGIPCPARDLEGAKKLVAASGLATPIAIEIQVANSPVNVRLAELVQSQEAEAGFAVKVTPLENTAAFKNQTDGTFEIQVTPWSGRVDPDGNIYRFQHSNGSDNSAKATDPAIDALLDQARAESDVAARKALYKQIVEAVRARRNVITFQVQNLYAAHTSALQGFAMYVDGMPRLKSASLQGG